jgi:23S rRNA (guanosine2251-2'-O)-methyltransferase
LIIYGKNSVKEFLSNTPSEIQELYIHGGSKKSFYEDIQKLCRKNKIKLTRLNESEISKLCKSTKHQGIAAEILDFQYAELEELLGTPKKTDENKLVVVLDHIEDPHNLGAIIRSVNVLGGDGVIIPKDRSAAITPAVIKASAGAVSYVPVVQEVNLSRVMEKLKQGGFWVVGADQNAEKNVQELDFSNRDIALVVGSEGKGLSSSVKKQCDYIVKIPLSGQVSSLNASVAAGILIYELRK